MKSGSETEDADLDAAPRQNYLPYPASTLSPQIVPTDLTSFKSRGAGKAMKVFRQQLSELQARYHDVVDEFNWNKLVFESRFNFEPVIGETYHLYQDGKDGFRLSLIEPGQWAKPYVGSFQLDAEGRWKVVEIAEGFDLKKYLEDQE